MEEMELYVFGEFICAADAGDIRDILQADTSPGQQEEFNRIWDILKTWAAKDREGMRVDIGDILSDGRITVQKTEALPILLSVISRKGALLRLPPGVTRTMTVYSNMQAAALEFRYRSLISLKELSEAVCRGLDGIGSGGMTPEEAEENITGALPDEMIALENLNDIRVLDSTVRGIERIRELCDSSNERLEDFIIGVRPMLDRLHDEEEKGEI